MLREEDARIQKATVSSDCLWVGGRPTDTQLDQNEAFSREDEGRKIPAKPTPEARLPGHLQPRADHREKE